MSHAIVMRSQVLIKRPGVPVCRLDSLDASSARCSFRSCRGKVSLWRFFLFCVLLRIMFFLLLFLFIFIKDGFLEIVEN